MSFTRKIENFTCEHCGAEIIGGGYTNHCPKCLWSKHVDVEPGDRAETCGGAMEPIGIEGSSPAYRLVHCCKKCGAIRRVNVATEDDGSAIASLAGIH